MAVTSLRAWTQLYADPTVTTSTTVAARLSGYEFWMSGEAQRRGITPGWSRLLPWALALAGEPVGTTPAHLDMSARPASGQGWPR